MVKLIKAVINEFRLDWFGSTIASGIVAACLFFVGICVYAVYRDATAVPPVVFSLRVDSWSCTDSQLADRTTYVVVGKVLVPRHSQVQVCTQWTHR